MASILRSTAILLLLFFLTQSFAFAASNKLANRILEVTGSKAQLPKIQEMVAASLAQQKSGVDPALYKEMQSVLLKSVDPATLEKKILSSLENDFSDSELRKLIDWFESPTGKRLVEAETAVTGKDALPGLRAFNSKFDQATTLVEKQPLINQMLDDLKLPEIITQFSVDTIIAIFEQRNKLSAKDKQIPLSAVTKNLEAGFSMVEATIRKELLQSLLYTYRNISNQDLKDYLAFLATAEAKKFHEKMSLVLYGTSPGTLRPKPAKSGLDLANIAEATNKSLPMMVDEETRFEKVEYEGNTLIYIFTLVNYASNQVDKEAFGQSIMLDVLSRTCNNKQLIVLFQSGVTLKFVYYGNDVVQLTEFDIHPSDCQQ